MFSLVITKTSNDSIIASRYFDLESDYNSDDAMTEIDEIIATFNGIDVLTVNGSSEIMKYADHYILKMITSSDYRKILSRRP